MRLYSAEGGVDSDELERALTLVKRRKEAPSQVDFLDDNTGELYGIGGSTVGSELEALPQLRRRLQAVQISHLDTARELERAERMLKCTLSPLHPSAYSYTCPCVILYSHNRFLISQSSEGHQH